MLHSGLVHAVQRMNARSLSEIKNIQARVENNIKILLLRLS